MSFFRSALCGCLLVFLATSIAAGSMEKMPPPEKVTIGLRDVINTVEKSAVELSGVSAEFFQRSTMAADNREFRASGEMFIRLGAQQPGMFRFNYFRPARQEIVCNGRNLWIYLPENRQVILSDVSFAFRPDSFDWDRRSSSRATNFIQGLGQISKDFHVSFAPDFQDIEGNYILELEPRRSTAFISRLFVVVDQHAVLNHVKGNTGINRSFPRDMLFPILSTTVIDHHGNSTTLELSNIKANPVMMQDLFNFDIPAGVDIVKPPPCPGAVNAGKELQQERRSWSPFYFLPHIPFLLTTGRCIGAIASR